jgi:hypothetical protein
MNFNLHVILRLGEESSSAAACEHPSGFFTTFRMTNKAVHQQRSEESSRRAHAVILLDSSLRSE